MERVYLFLHIFGVCLLFGSLGALALHVMNGGDKASNTNRKLIMMSLTFRIEQIICRVTLRDAL